jgi:hypothetical protein
MVIMKRLIKRVMKRTNESGMALISSLLVLMLMSTLLVGFIALITADQQANGANRDQTKAYAAAHAGLEKLTADLGQLFAANFSPTGTQVNALESSVPSMTGIQYLTPAGGSGYQIDYIDADADNAPDVLDENGTPISDGPYQGLVGLITPYTVTVTARTSGNAEVRMRRQMQTVAIPVFQFGIFSENDQSFFAGPNFAFGGRVHTNQNLWLKHDGTATLTLQDRVTAVGEVIRTHLANGQTTHPGYVRMAIAPGCPAAPTAMNGSCVLMGPQSCSGNDCMGSLTGTLGSGQNPNWVDFSVGTTHEYIRNWRTGARRLDLPLVSNGATPVDIIKRAPVGEVTTSAVGQQRFYNLASLRILLADDPAYLTALPGVVGTPIRLDGTFTADTSITGHFTAATARFARSSGVTGDGYRSTVDTPMIDGYIIINRQTTTGTWVDVTSEILSLGFSGRNISRMVVNSPPIAGVVATEDPCSIDTNYQYPNSIVRVQRFRDTPSGGGCHTGSGTNSNFWPNVLYDAREGARRDIDAQAGIFWSGVMHYVELDVNNLRRWFDGTIGNTGDEAQHTTGFVVYFSDRRTNVDASLGTTDKSTGEFGWEDFINAASEFSNPSGALDALSFTDAAGNHYAEDVNMNGTLQTYGNTAQVVNPTTGVTAATYSLWDLTTATQATTSIARVNRPVFFRRALKLVNGGKGQLPANPDNTSQGLTVASENPVYIQGNFNACTAAGNANAANDWTPACDSGVGFGGTPGTDHVSAAVIADAVTLLSSSWNDIRSFRNPHDVGLAGGLTSRDTRQAVTTWYRLGIIGGKGLNFQRPTSNDDDDHSDFGTDGGAHNFLRYLENWGGATLNYRGSLISFYTSRQAVGAYKCCDVVYSPPTRGYVFETEFLNPNLLPPRTPMFRDINTLTFRQILRPTEQ